MDVPQRISHEIEILVYRFPLFFILIGKNISQFVNPLFLLFKQNTIQHRKHNNKQLRHESSSSLPHSLKHAYYSSPLQDWNSSSYLDYALVVVE